MIPSSGFWRFWREIFITLFPLSFSFSKAQVRNSSSNWKGVWKSSEWELWFRSWSSGIIDQHSRQIFSLWFKRKSRCSLYSLLSFSSHSSLLLLIFKRVSLFQKSKIYFGHYWYVLRRITEDKFSHKRQISPALLHIN